MDDVDRNLALTPFSRAERRPTVFWDDGGSRKPIILGAPLPSACTALPVSLRRILAALYEPNTVPFSLWREPTGRLLAGHLKRMVLLCTKARSHLLQPHSATESTRRALCIERPVRGAGVRRRNVLTNQRSWGAGPSP